MQCMDYMILSHKAVWLFDCWAGLPNGTSVFIENPIAFALKIAANQPILRLMLVPLCNLPCNLILLE